MHEQLPFMLGMTKGAYIGVLEEVLLLIANDPTLSREQCADLARDRLRYRGKKWNNVVSFPSA